MITWRYGKEGGRNTKTIIRVETFPEFDGWLLCVFDNGEKRFVDIKPSMTGVLEKLKDPDFFNQVSVDDDAGTVAWPGELHIDPDTLYNRGVDTKAIDKLYQAIHSEYVQGGLKMELDTKQQVLVAIYTEYQKDVPVMDMITPKSLRLDAAVFNIALQKLDNEGYIRDAHFIIFDQSPYPALVVLSEAKMTREGLDYVETKLEIDKTITNLEKVKDVSAKAGKWGWEQIKDVAAKTLAEMLKPS